MSEQSRILSFMADTPQSTPGSDQAIAQRTRSLAAIIRRQLACSRGRVPRSRPARAAVARRRSMSSIAPSSWHWRWAPSHRAVPSAMPGRPTPACCDETPRPRPARAESFRRAASDICRRTAPRAAIFEILGRAVFAGEESAGEREISDHAESTLHAYRLEAGFVVRSVVEIVFGLQALVARQTLPLRDIQRLRQTRARS